MMAQMFCSGVAKGAGKYAGFPFFTKGGRPPQGNSPLFAHAPVCGQRLPP